MKFKYMSCVDKTCASTVFNYLIDEKDNSFYIQCDACKYIRAINLKGSYWFKYPLESTEGEK